MAKRRTDVIVLPDPDLIRLPDIPDPPKLQLHRIDAADRKVARVKSMAASRGWTTRIVRKLAAVTLKGDKHTDKKHFTYYTPDYTVYIAPDGTEYVDAHGNEKADLLHVGTTRMGKPPRRLRLLATSHHHKQTVKEGTLLQRAAKRVKEKQKAKRKQERKLKTLSRRK